MLLVTPFKKLSFVSCIVLWIPTRKLLSWDYRPLSLLGEANIITRLCVTEVRKHLSASQEHEESSGEIFWIQTKPKGIQQQVACWLGSFINEFGSMLWLSLKFISTILLLIHLCLTFVCTAFSPLLLHYVVYCMCA